MKKYISLLSLLVLVLATNAQSGHLENSRKVATKGYAEKEVTPDIIYLSISLKEYLKDGNAKKKTPIETLEKQLFESAIAAGVKKENLTIQNIYSYNYENKKKNNELLQSRQYRIKVTNLNGLDKLLDGVDPIGIQSTSISGYDYARKKEIEQELKTIAVKDARQNALILAAADDQSIGKVLVINDNSSINFNDLIPTPRLMYAKSASMNAVADAESSELNIDIRPMKLTCSIDAVFELK